MSDEDTFTPASRAQWRAWLAEHHATSTSIRLIYHKKDSGKPTVSYDEAVEEALCFGWIDSRVNTIDAERYTQMFSLRKRRSPWSKVNKERIERLMEQGLMTPAGLAKIEAAKQDGSWFALDSVEALQVPNDLQSALSANPTAAANFNAFSPSVRKPLLWWVETAKRPETRSKRVSEIVAAAEEKRNPLAYVPKDKRKP